MLSLVVATGDTYNSDTDGSGNRKLDPCVGVGDGISDWASTVAD